MDESGWVWRVCDFMIQTQPNLLKFFFFGTQPKSPSLKYRPNSAGRVGFGRSVGFLHTPKRDER